jgi:hypothetical protein
MAWHADGLGAGARGFFYQYLNRRIIMADQNQAVAQPTPASTGKAFVDMNGGEKLSFLGKVVVMLITGGFAFPNVFVE